MSFRFSNLLQNVAVHAAFLCSFAFSLTGFQAPRPAIAQGTAERVRSPEGMNAIQMQHQLEVLRARLKAVCRRVLRRLRPWRPRLPFWMCYAEILSSTLS